MSEMKNTRRSHAVMCIAVAALVSSACNEKGLPGKNRPLAEVQNVEWRYPVYEATPAGSKVVELGGRTWQITGASETVPASMLQSVSTVGGQQIYALKSDNAPYDRLYTPAVGGKYTLLANIN